MTVVIIIIIIHKTSGIVGLGAKLSTTFVRHSIVSNNFCILMKKQNTSFIFNILEFFREWGKSTLFLWEGCQVHRASREKKTLTKTFIQAPGSLNKCFSCFSSRMVSE